MFIVRRIELKREMNNYKKKLQNKWFKGLHKVAPILRLDLL